MDNQVCYAALERLWGLLKHNPEAEMLTLNRSDIEDLLRIRPYIEQLRHTIVQDAINRNITHIWLGPK